MAANRGTLIPERFVISGLAGDGDDYEEDEYMDMRVNKSPRKPATPMNDCDYVEVSPLSRNNVMQGRHPIKAYKPPGKFMAEESDYADMTGTPKHTPSNSRVKSPQASPMRMDHRAFSSSPISHKNDRHTNLLPSRSCDPRSPSHDIREGGFNKDDGDDYDDVKAIGKEVDSNRSQVAATNSHSVQKSPAQLRKPPQDTSKRVFVAPTGGTGWFGGGYNDSDSSGSDAESSDYENVEASEKHTAYTPAGRAARKYLLSGDDKSSHVSPSNEGRFQYSGVVRSTSRAGKSGAVQTRISKVKQYNSSKVLQADSRNGSPTTGRRPFLQRTQSTMSSERPDIEISKRKSQTMDKDMKRSLQQLLDRDVLAKNKQKNRLSDVFPNSRYDEIKRNEDSSHILDKEMVEWLDKTSPFTSRNPSVTSSPVYTPQKSRSLSVSSYAAGLSRRKAENINTESPATEAHIPLGHYAKTRLQHNDEERGESPIFASSKTLTYTKRPYMERRDFSDAAQAFHREYTSKQNKLVAKSKSTDNLDKSKRFRKSFRFTNKKKNSKSATPTPQTPDPATVKAKKASLTLKLPSDPVMVDGERPRASSTSASPLNHRADSTNNLPSATHSLGGGSVRLGGKESVDGFATGYVENGAVGMMERKQVTKAGTLGRIFSRKGKERRTVNQDMFSPEAGSTSRKYHTLSRNNGHILSPMFHDNLSTGATDSEVFLQGLRLTKGLTHEPNNNANSSVLGSKTPPLGVNKYATLSALSRESLATYGLPQKHKRSRSSFRGFDSPKKEEKQSGREDVYQNIPAKLPHLLGQRQKIERIHERLDEETLAAARVLYKYLLQHSSSLVGDHAANEEQNEDNDEEATVFGRCCFGEELVGWLWDQTHGSELMLSTRFHVTGIWQVLVEEGLLYHIRQEHFFEDAKLLYQFDRQVTGLDVESVDQVAESTNGRLPSSSCDDSVEESPQISEEELVSALADLKRKSPDAMFRSALRKLPEHRTATELDMIYDEILHINALKELSNEIKKQLTKVIQFEFHQQVGTTLFHQGDEGRSWYVILSGVVDVLIHGKAMSVKCLTQIHNLLASAKFRPATLRLKGVALTHRVWQGVVCSLHEGDDFGNLAIVNDAPRAATIVTAQPNCQFLRVEKFDFVKILNEVEAKTDRLKEHGKDVLILEKNSLKSRSGSMADTLTPSNYKYSIARGTVDKILEHILRYIQPWVLTGMEDSMEDFIITYKLFTDSKHLCEYLLKQYRAGDSLKKGVVYFVVRWSHIHTYIFHEDPDIQSFLKELRKQVIQDVLENEIYEELQEDLECVYKPQSSNNGTSGASQVILTVGTSVQRYPMTKQNEAEPIHDSDKVLLKIYDWNNTYTTVKLPISSTCGEIIAAACEKLSNSPSDFKLVELHENHDTNEIPKRQTSVATAISLNSRLYLTTTGNHPYLVNKQSASKTIEASHMESVSSLEIAYHLCKHNWNLMNNIHILEFLFKTCGGHKFKWTTSNLNVMARRFNQLAYWPPTEICLCANINKRVQLLRKFIKVAENLKMYHDMFGFMAVMIGIGNQAVSRLHDTWDKLPSKYRKMVQGFEGILDPSRNHRNYRLFVASTESTRIPYFPLIMKDLTFMQEGNDTFKDDLVNFEKMVDNLLETTKTAGTTKKYAITCPVITNQVVLNEMSNTVEPKRT